MLKLVNVSKKYSGAERCGPRPELEVRPGGIFGFLGLTALERPDD